VIKVTHIIAGLQADGAETVLHSITSRMDANRFENEVISLTDLGPMAARLTASGIPVRALGMRRGVANPLRILQLADWLKKSKPQVVQTWMYHADLIGGTAACLAGKLPVVWGIHHTNLDPDQNKRSTIWTARACAWLSRRLPERIVCCSEASREAHARFGYSEQKMQVIPNGFDLRRFHPDAEARLGLRQELEIPADALLIGMAARFHIQKGHRNFITAAASLHARLPDVHFVLCGKDVDESNSELTAWIKAAGLSTVCHLLGSREDMPRFFAALDVATSSSLSEAFPMAVGEAMACGTPCVVTDVGDSASIVGDTGKVAPASDPEALAAAWQEMLASGPAARQQMGQSARNRVEQRFNIGSIVERYQELYGRIAEAQSPERNFAGCANQAVPLRNHSEAQSRLLFVDNDVNSFYSYRIEMARAARDAGFDVHIAAPDGKAAVILLSEGFQFHSVPMTRSGLHPWKELATIAALFRLYRKLRPDLVHHLRLKPVLYGGLAAYGARVPAVVGLLTGLGYVFIAESRKAAVIRKLVTLSCKVAFRHGNQRIIFQNPDDQFVFVQNKILPARQTALIKGSGVDVNTYVPTPERDGVPVVVLASRMLRDKGVDEFVDAARSLRDAGVRARFVLVGETDPGNPTAITASQLQQWADSGVVEWWGHQGNMKDVLAQAHIVCLPSLREGVPKVLIEAAACGRAIVTTDAPGCREIVRNGENGLLVPVRNTRALAEALRLLIENPSLRASMGLKGRDIVVQEFSIERVVSETLGVYRELLAAGQKGSRELNIVEQQAR
jgi:glycosyltransferase involved in cell wall biosynthesis